MPLRDPHTHPDTRPLGALVIPVLDLMGGKVVRANGGDRASYPILNLRDARPGDAAEILSCLLCVYPFRTIYLADLDALTGKVPQIDLIERIHDDFPSLTLWVDAGTVSVPLPDIVSVIGTESLVDVQRLPTMMPANWCLSIDHRDGELIGCLPDIEPAWAAPMAVIDMNLACVGQRLGIAWRLSHVHPFLASRASTHRVLAGGIRAPNDLRLARDAGFSAVLCGSALYDGSLDAKTLQT